MSIRVPSVTGMAVNRHKRREGITISKKNKAKQAEQQIPTYDDSFDMAALDRFTDELTGKAKAEDAASQKAKKDALFDAIMNEELGKMAGEAKQNNIDLIPQVQPKASKPQNEAAKAVQTANAKKQAKPETKGKKKAGKTVLFVCIGVILVLAILICGLFVLDRGTILDNIYVAGVNVGGLDQASALVQVNAATNDIYRQSDLMLNFPEESILLSSDDTNVTLNAEEAVKAAYSYGRVLGIVRVPGITKVPTERTDIDLEPYFQFDSEAIRSLLSVKAETVYAELKQSEAKIEETPIETEESEEDEDEEEDEEETLTANKPERDADKTLVITKGITARTLDEDALYDMILHALSTVDFAPIEVAYDETAPDPVDLQKLFDENCILPEDASYNADEAELQPETLGYGFIVEDVQKLLDEAEEGETIEIPFEDLIPETTLDDLKGYMFEDKLASYDSPHTAIPNRTHNLELACAEIDGTILNDGEVFSFNQVVGERTTARGYRAAAVYVSGETEDQTGGGVCQVASTIYLCALMADMEIVERSGHYFQVTYVPLGMDATVYWGSLDFKFRNNTGYPIRIDASVSGGYVHIAIYGTDTKDYTVRMTYSVTGSSADGTSVVSYKHKLDSDGNEISCEKEASTYYHTHKPKEDEEEDDEPDDDNPEQPPATDPEPEQPPVTDPEPEQPPVTDPEPEQPPADTPSVE